MCDRGGKNNQTRSLLKQSSTKNEPIYTYRKDDRNWNERDKEMVIESTGYCSNWSLWKTMKYLSFKLMRSSQMHSVTVVLVLLC